MANMSSWGQVPPGMPMHHHCVVSVESSPDPGRWVDPSAVPPALVAWQYPDAVGWVREQIEEYARQADDAHRTVFERWLESYRPAAVGPDADHHYLREAGATEHVPTLWERLPQALQVGDWVSEGEWLSPGRRLCLQVIGYADQGQPAGWGGRRYQVCHSHRRPSDQPYLGLNAAQVAHYGRFGAEHVCLAGGVRDGVVAEDEVRFDRAGH